MPNPVRDPETKPWLNPVRRTDGSCRVLPDGTLINGFNRIQAISNRNKQRGYNVEVIRSTDKG